MVKNIFLYAFFLLGIGAYSQSVIADNIKGIWISNLGKGRVEIRKDSVGDKYHGVLIWLKVPNYPDGSPKLDKNNPDKSLTNRPLLGLVVINNLSFVKDHWEGGTIYDPESGKTYSCRAMLKEPKLELRGYIGVSQIGRTQTWERLNSPTSSR